MPLAAVVLAASGFGRVRGLMEELLGWLERLERALAGIAMAGYAVALLSGALLERDLKLRRVWTFGSRVT